MCLWPRGYRAPPGSGQGGRPGAGAGARLGIRPNRRGEEDRGKAGRPPEGKRRRGSSRAPPATRAGRSCPYGDEQGGVARTVRRGGRSEAGARWWGFRGGGGAREAGGRGGAAGGWLAGAHPRRAGRRRRPRRVAGRRAPWLAETVGGASGALAQSRRGGRGRERVRGRGEAARGRWPSGTAPGPRRGWRARSDPATGAEGEKRGAMLTARSRGSGQWARGRSRRTGEEEGGEAIRRSPAMSRHLGSGATGSRRRPSRRRRGRWGDGAQRVGGVGCPRSRSTRGRARRRDGAPTRGARRRQRNERERRGDRAGRVGEWGWIRGVRVSGWGDKEGGMGRPGGPGSPVGPNSPGKDGSSFVLFFYLLSFCFTFLFLFIF